MGFFALRTKQRFRVALGVCVTYSLVIAALAALFPRQGKSFASSFGWWLLAVPVGLAVYASLELFGTWALGLPLWQRMPSWARIALLVLVVSLCAVAAFVVGQYLER